MRLGDGTSPAYLPCTIETTGLAEGTYTVTVAPKMPVGDPAYNNTASTTFTVGRDRDFGIQASMEKTNYAAGETALAKMIISYNLSPESGLAGFDYANHIQITGPGGTQAQCQETGNNMVLTGSPMNVYNLSSSGPWTPMDFIPCQIDTTSLDPGTYTIEATFYNVLTALGGTDANPANETAITSFNVLPAGTPILQVNLDLNGGSPATACHSCTIPAGTPAKAIITLTNPNMVPVVGTFGSNAVQLTKPDGSTTNPCSGSGILVPAPVSPATSSTQNIPPCTIDTNGFAPGIYTLGISIPGILVTSPAPVSIVPLTTTQRFIVGSAGGPPPSIPDNNVLLAVVTALSVLVIVSYRPKNNPSQA
ncbi:MAG: hypothetical protein HY917_03160 [Candidatus Diapherotrites archaeon]|nr:hypothetical protein [Candidatus Diapherotrites archaeon]